MISDWNRSICGLLTEDVIPVNNTAAFINDVVLAAVNVPFCVFAVFSNLVAIVAVVRTTALHKPSNMLLCSLAFADCLSGVISQPLFIVRRLIIHRAHISCDYQLELYTLFRCSLTLASLLSFVNIAVMSFDRYCAYPNLCSIILTQPIEVSDHINKLCCFGFKLLQTLYWHVLCFCRVYGPRAITERSGIVVFMV